MSWETRNRGGRYYTRSQRINGQIVRQYIGCGAFAEQLAASDRLEWERREAERREHRQERDAIERDAVPIVALHAEVDVLARAALLAAGYHRHHGEWRRKRDA